MRAGGEKGCGGIMAALSGCLKLLDKTQWVPEVLQEHPKVRSQNDYFPRLKQDKGIVWNMILHDPCTPPHLLHMGLIFK